MSSEGTPQGQLPNYLFLDSQVHENNNHIYHSGNLKQLEDNCRKHEVRTIIPEVILGEINGHIAEKGRKTINQLKNGLGRTRWVFEKLKIKAEDIQALEDQFETLNDAELRNFLKTTSCLEIKATEKTMDDVLGAYFSGLPPFKQPRSRNDLPDAIAFFGLKNFAASNKAKIAVITGDKLLRNAFEILPEFFQTFETPKEYLAHVNAIADQLIDLHRKVIEDCWDQIQQAVGDALDEVAVEHRSHIYEVKSHKIKEVDVDYCDVANVHANGFTASFGAKVDLYVEVKWYEHRYHEDDPGGITHGNLTQTVKTEGYLRVIHEAGEEAPTSIEVESIETTLTVDAEAEEDRYDDYD